MTQPSNVRLITEDQASPLSNATPALPAITATGGASASTSRADHAHSSAGLFMPWGSGYDGDVVFDGTTTVVLNTGIGGTTSIVPSASVYTITIPIAANSISIGNGVTLVLAQGAILSARDTLTCPTGSCTIHVDGSAGAAGGTAGAARASAYRPATGAGGAGGTAAGSAAGATGGATDQWGIALGGAGGSGSGGAGGGTSGGTIANQGAWAWLARYPEALFRGEVYDFRYNTGPALLAGSHGGGGGGGDGTAGGGGGSGAGVLLVNAKKIIGNITFRANGGNGGSPAAGNRGGGGGGGGGLILVNSLDMTLYTGPTNSGTAATHAKGGTGGTKTGTGVNGSNASNGFIFVTVWA